MQYLGSPKFSKYPEISCPEQLPLHQVLGGYTWVCWAFRCGPFYFTFNQSIKNMHHITASHSGDGYSTSAWNRHYRALIIPSEHQLSLSLPQPKLTCSDFPCFLGIGYKNPWSIAFYLSFARNAVMSRNGSVWIYAILYWGYLLKYGYNIALRYSVVNQGSNH